MDISKADLAFQDVLDGHLNVRNSPLGGDDDLDDEAAAFLRGDPGPALALQKAHDDKVRARAASTPEERARALYNAGENITAVSRAVGWSRRKTNAFLNGGKTTPRVGIDYQRATELRKAGKKLKEIAAELKCSESRLSEVIGERRKDVPKEQILSLRKLGWTFRQIQKECNVTTLTVQKVIAEAAPASGVPNAIVEVEVPACA